MENQNKESRLRSMVSLATGFLPSLYYSSKMCELMDKAGFYQLDDFGGYTNIQTDVLLTSEMGLVALLLGGLFVGDKIGEFLEEKF